MPAYFQKKDTKISDFAEICDQKTKISDYPFAAEVVAGILIYNGSEVRQVINEESQETDLKSELCKVLSDGPGVFAIKNAYPDISVIDRSTVLFRDIISEEKRARLGQGDHFGNNERIWNSFQKTCLKDPELFIEYYGNPLLAIACQAWLGPFYQISAQVNNVKPGSQAQSSHRDYHLGFQSPDTVAQFPAHTQITSQYLTLQGAVAHADMPIESGPTMLLPFSHQFDPGYMTYALPEFRTYFENHQVQIPLQKGDMIFFNPALYHGAGTNSSVSDRIANLLQVSSPFGRTMETIDKDAMVKAVYPHLLERVIENNLSDRTLRDTISAVADGYPFPTNLDKDPPIGGNPPESGQQLLHRALTEHWPLENLTQAMAIYAARRLAN